MAFILLIWLPARRLCVKRRDCSPHSSSSSVCRRPAQTLSAQSKILLPMNASRLFHLECVSMSSTSSHGKWIVSLGILPQSSFSINTRNQSAVKDVNRRQKMSANQPQTFFMFDISFHFGTIPSTVVSRLASFTLTI